MRTKVFIRKRCPFCRYMATDVVKREGYQLPLFYVHCDTCGASGPWSESVQAAVASWSVRSNGEAAFKAANPTQKGPTSE